MNAKIHKNLGWLKLLLFIVGYVWMLVIPYPDLGRKTYSDENALQPAQVHTSYNWGDVRKADKYLEGLESLVAANATSERIATHLSDEFAKLGLLTATQAYNLSTTNDLSSGVNTYAILRSPRISGAEAILVGASWLSRTGEGDGTLNLRGVSTVLSIASFLRRSSHWAKDIIFVVSDGYMDGMQAFLTTYHGQTQSNIQAQPLRHSSGVIWTAMAIDYPAHSFSHLGVFHEALNGRLPNADLLHSFQLISRYAGGVPVIMYDHLDWREHPALRKQFDWVTPKWLPRSIRDRKELKTFAYHARNVWRHWGYQARGKASGIHGLMRQYRIDAFTMFALPAVGPHGFHAIGKTIESTLRTMNNLLERLHASVFFYTLTAPDRFIKIGNYLPSAVIVSVAMMFTGLGFWVDAGWERILVPGGKALAIGGKALAIGETAFRGEDRWKQRSRPVLAVLMIMALTHALGGALYTLCTTAVFLQNIPILLPLISLLIFGVPIILSSFIAPSASSQISKTLQALNLSFASTIISITTVLNFSLAALLCALLGLPLALGSSAAPTRSSPSSSGYPLKYPVYTLYALLGYGFLTLGLLYSPNLVVQAIQGGVRDWEAFGVWFVPLFCGVYVPLVVQAGVVVLLA